MREKEKAQIAAVKDAEARAAEARDRLVAAMQQREMLDKLRERAYARYLEDEKHAEQMVVDEIVSYKIGRSGNGESIEET
jgi:flagellar FliJ protein